MPFEFPRVTPAKLTHVNVRRELHGEEHVPAMDLSLRLEGSNELLDLLDPSLRLALYYNAAAKAGQENLPEVLAHLPNLRLAKLNAQKFKWAPGERHKGYRFVLDYGLGEEADSNVELDACTVTGWNFETKEGGTVILEFVVQYAGEKLTADARGKLTGLTDETIHIQLFAPAVLEVIKGKAKSHEKPADGDGASGDLLNQGGEGGGTGDDTDDGGGNADDGGGDDGPDTPEKAMQRAHGVTATTE